MFLEQMTAHLARWRPVDVRELAPLLVTYRPTQLPGATALHQEMLKAVPDPSKLFPGAPNREAVEHNLRGSIAAFQDAHQDFVKQQPGAPLATWRDLLHLNIRHVTSARRHYGNGQATVTCLAGDDGTFSVALHDDVDAFLSELASQPSLTARNLSAVASESEADAQAIRWLAVAKVSEIRVRVDGASGAMTWRTWGSIPGQHGYRRHGLVLTLGDRVAWTEVEDCPGSEFEPYGVLNRLAMVLPGVEADTCATCASFAFSGMSRDMSGGSKGYCRHPDRQEQRGRGSPIVDVWYRCDRHCHIADSDREHPYLRV